MWLVGCWLMAIYRRCTICASGWLAILRAAVHPDAHFHCELRRGSSSGSWFINWDRVLIRFVREVRHSPASTFRNKKWEGSGASELCNNILMANGGGGGGLVSSYKTSLASRMANCVFPNQFQTSRPLRKHYKQYSFNFCSLAFSGLLFWSCLADFAADKFMSVK